MEEKKTKLINVSNFLKQFSDQIPGDKIDAIELRLALLNEPTVDAIPIEFIKRFATFSPPTPIYIYGEEGIDMDAWCEGLLENWEKENETQL